MNEQKKTKGAKWFGIPNLVPYRLLGHQKSHDNL